MPEPLQEAELVMDEELVFDDKANTTLLHRERRVDRLVREGEVLAGKYRVERIPGRAGMGVIVQVRHLELGQEVTLKFLIPDACAYPEFVQRFVREARAAVKIGGEHVARVTDVGRLDSGAPYMVREFLRGPDLAEIVKVRGPLPVAEAVDYIIQACEGVAEGHALGIVHRNLRPTTLVVTRRSDGSPLVKVFDFAAAEALHVDPFTERSLSLVGTSAIMSSLPYLSPEQIRDPHDVDVRADVYALGAILYELLTGSPAYRADNAPSLLAAVAADAARSVRELRPDVAGDLDHAVLRCLAKNRAIRYSGIADLVLALAPFASRDSAGSIERVQRLAAQASLGAAKAAPAEPAAPAPLWQGLSNIAISGAGRGPTGTLIVPPMPEAQLATPLSSDDVTVAQPLNSYQPLAQERARTPLTTQPASVRPSVRPRSNPPPGLPVVPPPHAPSAVAHSQSLPMVAQAPAAPETTAYAPPHRPPSSQTRTTVMPPSMPPSARPRASRSSLPSGMSRSWAVAADEDVKPKASRKRLFAVGGGAAAVALVLIAALRSSGPAQPVAAAAAKPAPVVAPPAPAPVEPAPVVSPPEPVASASAAPVEPPPAAVPAAAPPAPAAVVAAAPAAPARKPVSAAASPNVAPRPKRAAADESDAPRRTAAASVASRPRDMFDSPE